MKFDLFAFLERYSRLLIIGLTLLLAAGYVQTFPRDYPGMDRLEYGFYGFEKWNIGKIRWTGQKTCMRLRAESNLFGFRVLAQPHNSRLPDGLSFRIYVNKQLLDVLHFVNGGSRCVYYYLPDIAGRNIDIRTEVDRTFRPVDLKINADTRELGVAMSPLTFLEIMPRQGIGLYQQESTRADIPGWPETQPKVFRWTKRRATLPLETMKHENGLTLFLKATHPGIDEHPVQVSILGDGTAADDSLWHKTRLWGRLLQQVTLRDSSWRRVMVSSAALKGQGVVTFQVSRTWNPKHTGISEDDRDLGVALAIP